jgi:hypothetical protein
MLAEGLQALQENEGNQISRGCDAAANLPL